MFGGFVKCTSVSDEHWHEEAGRMNNSTFNIQGDPGNQQCLRVCIYITGCDGGTKKTQEVMFILALWTYNQSCCNLHPSKVQLLQLMASALRPAVNHSNNVDNQLDATVTVY